MPICLIYDLVKAFDVLWVIDCMNDLWDTLPDHARDDRRGLFYEASKTNLVAVNTAVGQTDSLNIPEIAQRVGAWGPKMCSNSIEKQYFYMVNIIPLAMVDDLISVTSCGKDSIEMNISINTKIELKKTKISHPRGQQEEQMQHDACWEA
jgi:hypothetical protein